MRRLILLSLVMLITFTLLPNAHAQPEGVSEARFAHLQKGINLGFWFWLPQDDDPATIPTRYQEGEFEALSQMGFTFARIPLDYYLLAPEGTLAPDRLAMLDEAIQALLAADLAVVLDLHSVNPDAGNATYSGNLETDDAFVEEIAAFWFNLGQFASQYDHERVFLEIFNEPVFLENSPRWREQVLPRLVTSARAGAPDLTFIVSGAYWASLEGLQELTPLDDPNIVYNFHFYEPFLFTHQGAEWISDSAVMTARDIPYPANAEAVAPLLNGTDEKASMPIRAYGEEEWDYDALDALIYEAVEWAEEHGVRLTCTEFGAYTAYAPRESRLAWLDDVTDILEDYGIGWAMWEYDGSFGFTLRNEASGRVLLYDNDVLDALGLTPLED